MINTSSLDQIFRTGDLDADLLLREHKIDLMARLRDIKSVNPKRKKTEIARELGYSSPKLQRYRQGIKMQSPYKSNNPKRRQMTSTDLKRPQMTSKRPLIDYVNSNKKSKLKAGDQKDDNSTQHRDNFEQAFSSE